MSNGLDQNGLAPWTLLRTVAPAARPVSLEQAKDHLNLDQGDTTHDQKLLIYIDSAQERVEHDSERVLIDQTFTAIGNRFPTCDAIPLDRNPVSAVTGITYIDGNGDTQTLDPSQYDFDPARRAVFPAIGAEWPAVTVSSKSVVVTFTAGYGTSGDQVPADLLSCMFLVLDQLFYGIDNTMAYDNLIERYKRTRYP